MFTTPIRYDNYCNFTACAWLKYIVAARIDHEPLFRYTNVRTVFMVATNLESLNIFTTYSLLQRLA